MFDCATLMLEPKPTTRDVPWVLTVKVGCRVQNVKLHVPQDDHEGAMTKATEVLGPVDWQAVRDGVWRAAS